MQLARVKKPSVSIIIVSFNVKKYILNCLKSIKKNYPKFKTELIIIDNNSLDGTFLFLERYKLLKLKLIKNKKNIGFSKAINFCIKKSSGDIIILLNPDTIILNDSLNKIIEFSLNEKNKNIGIFGGKTYKSIGKQIHRTYFNKINFLTALFEFTNLKKIFPNNTFHKKFYYINKNKNKGMQVLGVSGGFMLIKRYVFEKIGYFDEKFFLYLEDIDFCLRARKKGIKSFYYPAAQIRHEFGASSKNKKGKINIKSWRDSRKYFFSKHFGFFLGNFLKIFFILEDKILDFKNLWRENVKENET